MFANIKTRKIEMTKKEANAIGKTTTPEFQEFVTLKSVYPTFDIKVVTPKAKSSHKGLTYPVMENYIKNSKRENMDEILSNFETLKKDSSTFKVKEWFLGTFPEIEQAEKERRENVEKLLNEAKQNKIEYLRKVA